MSTAEPIETGSSPLAAARAAIVNVLLQRAGAARPLADAVLPLADAVLPEEPGSADEVVDSEALGSTTIVLDETWAGVTLDSLIEKIGPSSRQSARQLGELKRVALSEAPDPIDARAWAGIDLVRTFDPELLATRASTRDHGPLGWIAAGAEFVRNFLVLVPVTFTWIGLGKAAAVYATCEADPGAPSLLAQTPFLRLWERGFTGINGITCDTSRGSTYGLPLNSFGEVVFADFVVLLALIGLTVVVHFYSNLRATRATGTAQQIADELRAVLTFCAMRLRRVIVAQDAAMLVLKASENLRDVARQFQEQAAQLMVRSEQGTGELVLRASENLATVATRFEQQAVQMMSALQMRSTEAEERLAELGRSSMAVSESTLATVSKLDQVLQAVTATTQQLASVSIEVRDQLAGTASALQDSATQARAQLQGVAARIDGVTSGLTEVDRSAKELLASWQRADRALEQTRDTVGAMSEQLSELQRVETDAKNHVGSMSERFLVLEMIRKELVQIKIGQQRAAERQGLPQPAWRLYGYMQVAQIGLLALVLGSVIAFGFMTLNRGPADSTLDGETELVVPSRAPARAPTPTGDALAPSLMRGPF